MYRWYTDPASNSNFLKSTPSEPDKTQCGQRPKGPREQMCSEASWPKVQGYLPDSPRRKSGRQRRTIYLIIQGTGSCFVRALLGCFFRVSWLVPRVEGAGEAYPLRSGEVKILLRRHTTQSIQRVQQGADTESFEIQPLSSTTSFLGRRLGWIFGFPSISAVCDQKFYC